MLAIWRDICCNLAALLIESAIRGFQAVDRVAVRKVAGWSHTPSVPAARRARNFICALARFTAPRATQDMGTFGSPISGSGCVNFSDERELLSRASRPLSTPPAQFPLPPNACLHACGLPCGVRPFSPDTVHKHFKQNSGKSEFVLREGSVAGKEPSREERKRGETRGSFHTYITRRCPCTFIGIR